MAHRTEPAEGFIPFATAALDFHQALNIPTGPLVADRAELDSLHGHFTALIRLLDAQTERSRGLVPGVARPLASARTRAWQVADLLHTAFHAVPHADNATGSRTGLPDGAPELSICRRHQQASLLLRRRATPTDLRHNRP
ncbi:DUF6238 family protein [Streptomyces cellulosae]|jgi:hypothetical protein|uniref:DUF6238 family protein n=1 Tax=Streptomyces sp. P9-2 TaxID=3423201 RepID=UPI0016727F5A|nr:hypothetical protein GCM10018771_39500 [Streptomyces cellulosae]